MKLNFFEEKNNQLWIFLMVIFLVLASSGCGSNTETASKTTAPDKSGSTATVKPSLKAISLGTSSVGSAYYAISIGMSDIITKKSGINVSVEPVGGSDANVRALMDNKIEIGMLNAASATSALQGIGTFATKGKAPLRIMAQGQESLRNVVVRNDSGIKTIADLKGKKFIARRKSLADIELTAKALLKAYNMTENDVKIIETAETNQAIEALKTGTADAAIIPGGAPSSDLTDLATSTSVTFLSIPDDKLNLALKELGPAFHKAVIKASTYKGQEQEVALPSMSTELVIMSNFPEDDAYLITKTLMESQKELQAIHNEGKSWSIENTLKDPPVPFHPGAIKYFKEIGAWTPQMDTWQQSLLK